MNQNKNHIGALELLNNAKRQFRRSDTQNIELNSNEMYQYENQLLNNFMTVKTRAENQLFQLQVLLKKIESYKSSNPS